MERTMNVEQAVEAQKSYLKSIAPKYKNDWTGAMFARGQGFAPINGVCFMCRKQIYQDYERKGFSVEEAGNELITYCPHCNHSFVD